MTQNDIMQYEFVSVYDVEEQGSLVSWLEQFQNSGEDLVDTAIRTFEGDPDYVKVGKHGRVYFIVLAGINTVMYLDVETEFDERIKRVIADYVGEGASDVFTERNLRTWNEFDTVDCGIAYRGGRGYVYSLAEVSPEWWARSFG